MAKELQGLDTRLSLIAPFTEEQITEMRSMFLLFDQNDDQTILVQDLGTIMRALGQYPTDSEVKSLIDEIDADGNGKVEFPEFVDLMSRRPYGFRGSESELSAAFQPFDEYGSGIMNMAALRRALTTLGEPLTDEQLDDMFKQAEVDGDGNVEYKEFIDMMTGKR